MKKRSLFFAIILLSVVTVFGEIDSSYRELVYDLANAATYGYKGLSLDRADPVYFDPLLQGEFAYTDRMLDFAINGKGFFKVIDPKTGEAYFSRNGRFHTSNNNSLVTTEGYILQPEIRIENDEIIEVDCINENIIITYKAIGIKKYRVHLYGSEKIMHCEIPALYTFANEFEYNGLEHSLKAVFPKTLEMSTTNIISVLKNMKILILDEILRSGKPSFAMNQLALINELLKKDIRVVPSLVVSAAEIDRGGFPVKIYSQAEWLEIVNKLSLN
jgi:hypothetical protein